jgi:hypothetical protein
MSKSISAVCSVALVIAICTLPAPARAGASPADDFALGHWKLTLPVDGSGRKYGEAAEIPASMLVGGYHSRWFRAAADGGMEFWAPLDGATTDGSDYPRSELREMLSPDDDNANWSLAGHSVLTANCEVLGVPASNGKVVIGQIHAFDGPPLVKLRYQFQPGAQTGRLDALVNVQPSDAGATAYPLAADLPMRTAFDYRIEVMGGSLIVTAAGGASVRLPIDPSWQRYSFYFKAGVYVQANGNSSLDGGRVRFHALDVSH